MSSPLPDHDPFNRSSTNRAWFPFSSIYAKVILKISTTIDPIDARAVAPDTLQQGIADSTQQNCRLFTAQIIGTGQGMQLCLEKRFIGIDISHTRQKGLIHKKRLQLPLFCFQHLIELINRERFRKRLWSEIP